MINWINPENVRMGDTQGKTMLCKCGKPAGSGIFGKESFKTWCADCSPYKDFPVAEFVYRPPKGIREGEDAK